MNKESTKKITALGVVIFSFVSILIYMLIVLGIDSLTVLLVLKTKLSEDFLKIGSVMASGIGLITSTALLTVQTKLKGIYAAAMMFGMVFLIKIIGNGFMKFGGYFTLNGFIGILFLIVFALAGGILGSLFKK